MPGSAIERLNPQQQQLLALLVVALACLAIVFTLARYLPGWLGGSGTPAATADTSPDAEPGRNDRASLSDYSLFGEAAGDAAGGTVKVDVPVSELALTLHGTIAAPDPEQAMAIIADGEGVERTYRLDSELPGGAVLKEVHPDRAIVRYRGRLESLPLRDPQRQSQAANRNREGVGARRAQAPSAEELRRFRDAALSDPAELASRISLQPVQENGRVVGMRVESGVSATLLAQLGIRPTDVITRVNGVELDSAERAREIMEGLANAEQIRVTLQRDGQSRQLTVPLGR